jgi:agmatinase
MSNIFNHNELSRPNGNWFALPCDLGKGDIVIISAPWDVTTSYKSGTSGAPEAVIKASAQIDLFDADLERAWEMKISGDKMDSITGLNEFRLFHSFHRVLAKDVIRHLENGGNVTDEDIDSRLVKINEASSMFNEMIYGAAHNILGRGKTAAVVGGDHSTPFGLIRAVAEKYPGVGILHFDAHADLRKAYEGFEYSHASIMYNVITKINGIARIVQVGVRDYCEDEAVFIAENDRIITFFDDDLARREYEGVNWATQCSDIINCLPQQVYISFDIDGLRPEFCPNTGTPVPGGLDFRQAAYLLRQLALSGRQIVGFDLCEVAPAHDDNEWDANVGARMLFKLCCCTTLTKAGM